MVRTRFQNVVLIGVGLIGGSLARDLIKNKIAKSVIGIDIDKKNLNYAVRHKIVSRAGRDVKDEIAKSDLVILATPVLTLNEQIKDLASYIPKMTLVIDVGSTKEQILKTADRYFKSGNFVGCHPMAGSEKSGAAACVDNLFKGAPCIIVRGKNSKAVFVNKAKKLWQGVGSKVVELSLKEHDRYLAACSHLPHALSFALMRAVGKRIDPNSLKTIAGKGFKSYTRIAGSDAHMWADIFLVNRQNTLNKIRYFKKELEQLEKLIKNKDYQRLASYINKSAKMWKGM